MSSIVMLLYLNKNSYSSQTSSHHPSVSFPFPAHNSCGTAWGTPSVPSPALGLNQCSCPQSPSTTHIKVDHRVNMHPLESVAMTLCSTLEHCIASHIDGNQLAVGSEAVSLTGSTQPGLADHPWYKLELE